MKKLIPLLLAVLSIGGYTVMMHQSPVYARMGAPEQQAKPKTNCTDLGKVAWSAMDKRQGGMDFAEAYKVSTSEVWQMAVRIAYNQPRYFHIDNKIRAMQDFKNMSIMACLEQGGSL